MGVLGGNARGGEGDDASGGGANPSASDTSKGPKTDGRGGAKPEDDATASAGARVRSSSARRVENTLRSVPPRAGFSTCQTVSFRSVVRTPR